MMLLDKMDQLVFQETSVEGLTAEEKSFKLDELE